MPTEDRTALLGQIDALEDKRRLLSKSEADAFTKAFMKPLWDRLLQGFVFESCRDPLEPFSDHIVFVHPVTGERARYDGWRVTIWSAEEWVEDLEKLVAA